MLTFRTPKMFIKTLSSDGTYAEIVYENILKGMSTTLGNSIRRILLDFIPGMSPVGISIGGTLKPFNYLTNIVESSLEIADNASKIVIKCPDDIQSVNLVCNSPRIKGLFRAGDLTLSIPNDNKRVIFNPTRHDPKYNSGVTVGESKNFYVTDEYYTDKVKLLNPELILFHCSSTEEVILPQIAVKCNQGVYKSSSSDPARNLNQLEYLPTKINHSPVVSASYVVEDGSSKLHDNLIIKVKTTGAISPTEAIEQACILLRTQFDLLSYTGFINIEDRKSVPFKVYPEGQDVYINNEIDDTSNSDINETLSAPTQVSVEQTFIELLELSDVTFNHLKMLGVNDVSDLIAKDSKIDASTKQEIFASISTSHLPDYTKSELRNVLMDIGFASVSSTDSLLS